MYEQFNHEGRNVIADIKIEFASSDQIATSPNYPRLCNVVYALINFLSFHITFLVFKRMTPG